MRLKTACVVLLGFVVAGAGTALAADHAIVQPKVNKPDNVTRPALVAFIDSVPAPTIVLRVPAPQTSVSQAQGSQGSAGLNRAYLAIEKELVKSGFVVRDRGLLEEILRSNQNLDYKIIQEKINAQLILEIVSIGEQEYNTADYVDAKKHTPRHLEQGTFPIKGWHIESRIVMVNSGEIGGIYAADVVPQDLHFMVAGRRIFNASSDGKMDRSHTGYAFGPVENAAPIFFDTLIKALKPKLARAPLGASVVLYGSDTSKKMGFKFQKKLRGALVTSITRESRAAEGGLAVGDVIEGINGKAIMGPEEVDTAVKLAGAGPLTMKVTRGGNSKTITIPAP